MRTSKVRSLIISMLCVLIALSMTVVPTYAETTKTVPAANTETEQTKKDSKKDNKKAADKQAAEQSTEQAAEQTTEDLTVADSGNNSVDTAGNVILSGDKISYDYDVTNELIAYGQTVEFVDLLIKNNIFIAGKDVILANVKSGSSICVGGYKVEIDAKVDNNIWAAGSKIDLQENTVAKSIGAAAQEITVKGNYKMVKAAAETIYFDAVVEGDVSLTGKNIEIGENAKVTGIFKINSSAQPVVADGADIPNMAYTQTRPEQTQEQGTAAKEGPAEIILEKLQDSIFWIILFVIMGLFITLFMGDAVDRGKQSVGEHPVRTFFAGILFTLILMVFTALFGFLGLLAAPLLIMGAVGLLLLILMILICRIYFACVLAGKLFKKASPYITAVVFAVVAGLIKVVPYLGIVVGVISFFYTVGCLAQGGFRHSKEDKEERKGRKLMEKEEQFDDF